MVGGLAVRSGGRGGYFFLLTALLEPPPPPRACRRRRATVMIYDSQNRFSRPLGFNYPRWYRGLKGTSPLENDWAKLYRALISAAASFLMIHSDTSGLAAACVHFPMSSGRKSRSVPLTSHICGFFIFIFFFFFFGYVSISSFSPFMNGVVTAPAPRRHELWFQNIINNYFKPLLPVMCLPSQLCRDFRFARLFCVLLTHRACLRA